MQKTILTACFTLFLGLFLAATATAALMQYSGGGNVFPSLWDDPCGHGFPNQGETPFGIDHNSQVSWSVTYDTNWMDHSGTIDLGHYLDQGAALTMSVGDFAFTYNKDSNATALFPQVSLKRSTKTPKGFNFQTFFRDEFGSLIAFTNVFHKGFSFLSTDYDSVWGKFDFKHISQGSGASAVPIPGAVWLLGTGLLALVGVRRKITW